jgi:hypothetical protein
MIKVEKLRLLEGVLKYQEFLWCLTLLSCATGWHKWPGKKHKFGAFENLQIEARNGGTHL